MADITAVSHAQELALNTARAFVFLFLYLRSPCAAVVRCAPSPRDRRFRTNFQNNLCKETKNEPCSCASCLFPRVLARSSSQAAEIYESDDELGVHQPVESRPRCVAAPTS